ncbi:N-acetyltransferase, partial [Micromonospora orduensis]
MDTVPRIRAARWADKDHVAALISDALNPSPLATWLIPDPSPRRRILTDVLAIWIEHAMFYGDIYLTDDATAATVGFHRYRPIPP